MTASEPCPLCKAPCKQAPADKAFFVECEVCGAYFITWEAKSDLPGDRKVARVLHMLQAVTRESSDAAEMSFDPKRRVTIRTDNAQQLIDAFHIPDEPIGRMNRLLAYVGRQQDNDSSETVELLPQRDYPVAACKSGGELQHLADTLGGLGLLESPLDGEYRLTMHGWERLYELDRESPQSDAAFVAMWFSPELSPAWSEGFEPALRACGYDHPIRMDLEEHNDKICDRILVSIRKSSLLVADLTGNRGGVYFEAGFALGLGLPVVWCCQKAFHKDHEPHFDARQYNYILWEDPADLRERLIARIEATVPRASRMSR